MIVFSVVRVPPALGERRENDHPDRVLAADAFVPREEDGAAVSVCFRSQNGRELVREPRVPLRGWVPVARRVHIMAEIGGDEVIGGDMVGFEICRELSVRPNVFDAGPAVAVRRIADDIAEEYEGYVLGGVGSARGQRAGQSVNSFDVGLPGDSGLHHVTREMIRRRQDADRRGVGVAHDAERAAGFEPDVVRFARVDRLGGVEVVRAIGRLGKQSIDERTGRIAVDELLAVALIFPVGVFHENDEDSLDAVRSVVERRTSAGARTLSGVVSWRSHAVEWSAIATGKQRSRHRRPVRMVRSFAWIALGICLGLVLPTAVRADESREAPRPMALGFNLDLLPTVLSAANGKLGYAPQVWLGLGHARVRFVGAHLEPPTAFAFAPSGFRNPTTTAFAALLDYTFGSRFDGAWVGSGFEVWMDSIEHDGVAGTARWTSVVFTGGGGYIGASRETSSSIRGRRSTPCSILRRCHSAGSTTSHFRSKAKCP